jgi:hypothetical protein
MGWEFLYSLPDTRWHHPSAAICSPQAAHRQRRASWGLSKRAGSFYRSGPSKNVDQGEEPEGTASGGPARRRFLSGQNGSGAVCASNVWWSDARAGCRALRVILQQALRRGEDTDDVPVEMQQRLSIRNDAQATAGPENARQITIEPPPVGGSFLRRDPRPLKENQA